MSNNAPIPAHISALDATEARAHCAALIAQRQRLDANIATQRTQLAAYDKTTAPHMAPLALVLQAVAERAGLGHVEEVCAMAHTIGDMTYPQWGTPIPAPSMPDTAVPRTYATDGDAEMVLSADLMRQCQAVGAILFGFPINSPYDALEQQVALLLHAAASEALAARGCPLRLRTADLDDIQDPKGLSSQERLAHAKALLADYAHDLACARTHLQGNMRMAVIHASTPALHIATNILYALVHTPEKAPA